MIMRFNEIHNFSGDTLHQIDEALDYQVKEFKVNRMNPGLNTRFWTRKGVDRSKEFMFSIQKRLKTRRIFRNLESFIGGRVREEDYRLLKDGNPARANIKQARGRRMSFGLCNAPATFQRCMVAIFHDMVEDFIEVFMDDFLTKGAENLAADHLLRLENLNMGELTKEEITNKVPDEHLIILKAKINDEEPWYANYVNYIVRKVVPPKWTPERKNGSSLK
nr:hypothetical protein [Tanacetum cinerariifolium]